MTPASVPWGVNVFYPSPKMFLKDSRTQGSAQLAKLQRVILALAALANN